MLYNTTVLREWTYSKKPRRGIGGRGATALSLLEWMIVTVSTLHCPRPTFFNEPHGRSGLEATKARHTDTERKKLVSYLST